MKIISRVPRDLKQADYNPRQLTDKQYKDLKTSIQKFGLIDPIIVNENKKRKDIVIGGHQRLKVALDLGHDTVPCVHLDLSIKEEKELNVRLNKNTGQWDYDVLANEFDMEELVDWGFNEKSLLGLFDEIDYSILEDNDVDEQMENLEKETRKAIQIEFTVDDYELAFDLYKQMREKYEYVGAELIEFFRGKLNE
tara:strand:+ start:7700 stop:8284 length:585 start_codon:yes stop_codon:yes gene_type:complete